MSSSRYQSWAHRQAIALGPLRACPSGVDWGALGQLIGDAAVVLLSEAMHGTAEFLEFRNRLFQYLVEEKKFTALALETGLTESRRLFDWVRGSVSDTAGGESAEGMATAMALGFTWQFDRLPQNVEMVQWLRDANAKRSDQRPLHLYGFDISGSPGASKEKSAAVALTAALNYMQQVDGQAAKIMRARVSAFLPHIGFNFCRCGDSPGYERLGQAERDVVTGTIENAVSWFERHEARCCEGTSEMKYQWAYRAAVGARQTDAWLRQVPIGWCPGKEAFEFPSEAVNFLDMANDVRDRAQADNVRWILEQEGPDAKVMVFAHRYHVSGAPVSVTWGQRRAHPVMATYLRRRLESRVLIIGSSARRGSIDADLDGGFDADGSDTTMLAVASGETLDGWVGDIGVSNFVIDLRSAPLEVKDRLSQPWALAHGYGEQTLVPLAAFDALVHFDTVTPALGV